jgi:hypothetical protein
MQAAVLIPTRSTNSAARRHVAFMSVVLALAAAMLGGCALPLTNYRNTFGDEQSDQPWIGPGVRARATICVKADFVRIDQRLVWLSPDGREFDADDTVERCERYLRHRGMSREPAGADQDGNPVQAVRWGPHGEALTAAVTIYPDTPMLVCVDPIIVVVILEPRSIDRAEEVPGVMDKEGQFGVRKIRHTLRYGYQRGTGGTWRGDLLWYSPDLEAGPEALSFSDDGVATLTTQWGMIEVRRNESGWQATAKRTD